MSEDTDDPQVGEAATRAGRWTEVTWSGPHHPYEYRRRVIDKDAVEMMKNVRLARRALKEAEMGLVPNAVGLDWARERIEEAKARIAGAEAAMGRHEENAVIVDRHDLEPRD